MYGNIQKSILLITITIHYYNLDYDNDIISPSVRRTGQIQ